MEIKNFLLCLGSLLIGISSNAATGVLVLAHGSMHGGSGHRQCHLTDPPPWEKSVLEVVKVAQLKFNLPTEVSFGMWETQCIDHSIEMLKAQMAPKKLDELIVVPFFISSFSSVIEIQKYIFGLRGDLPLPIEVPRTSFKGKIKYTQAIDYSPAISEILKDRTKELVETSKTKSPQHQELYIVMHGPVEDLANHKWLEMGQRYAGDLSKFQFMDIKVVSLRDDIDEPMRSQITEDLRGSISTTLSRGREALILPHLLSNQGIQAGILDRLKDLEIVWTGKALAPDLRLADIIVSRVKVEARK